MSDSMTRALPATLTLERNILRNSFVWMTLGLAFTGVVAWGVSNSPGLLRVLVLNRFLYFGLIFGQLGAVWFLASRVLKMSPAAAAATFVGYSALTGVTLSVVFLVYTAASIASVFFITAGMFASLAFLGYATKIDLTKMGSYLMMGVIGLVIASVANIFLRSDGLGWIVSLAGVVIFAGLTAYDVQKIKAISARFGSEVDEGNYLRLSIYGALQLYLDFINLFLHLLRIVGRRK